MLERFQKFLGQVWATIKACPVEAALTVYFFIFGALVKEEFFDFESSATMLLFPLFFTLSYLLNRWLPKLPLRIVYFLSGLVVVPFFWVDVSAWALSMKYAMALVIALLILLSSNWDRDNEAFVQHVLTLVKNLLLAFLLGGIVFMVVGFIYMSLTLLFPMIHWGRESSFFYYLAMAVFFVIAPLVFLTFQRKKQAFKSARFLDILANYVLAPALIVYTLILYVYFLTIVVQWSLPKGGVAYMVFAFTLVAFIVKSYQPFVAKRLYDWYFDRFSLISLPALLMFWVGVLYRVKEYGLTQSRIYLLICGLVMTTAVLLFFSRRHGRYLYICLFAAGLFFVSTYIPPVSAARLGIESQLKRLDKYARELNMLDADGKFIREKRPATDSLLALRYEAVYESFHYVYYNSDDTQQIEARFGLRNLNELNDIMPFNLQYGNYRDPVSTPDSRVIVSSGLELDLSAYRKIRLLSGRDYENIRGTVKIFYDADTLSISYTEILDAQREIGRRDGDSLTLDWIESRKEDILVFPMQDYDIVFSSMHLWQEKEGLTIRRVEAGSMLIK